MTNEKAPLEPRRTRLREAVRFVVTGGLCFLVEFAFLVLFRDTVGLDTLVAAALVSLSFLGFAGFVDKLIPLG